MEPQAEEAYMYEEPIKTQEEQLYVQISDEVAYCPYNGSYQDMINKAYELDDKKIMKALIEYRDDMIKRDNMIKDHPEQDSHISGEIVN